MAIAGVGGATAVVVVDAAVVALVGWSVLVVLALPESNLDRLDGSLHYTINNVVGRNNFSKIYILCLTLQ